MAKSCPWCGQEYHRESAIRLKLLLELQQRAEGKGLMGYQREVQKAIQAEQAVLNKEPD